MILRQLISLAIFLVPFLASGQADMPNSVDEVIKWNFNVTYDKDIATIHIVVDQKDGWHIYAQKQPKGAINVPTSFVFAPDKSYELIGKTTESESEEHVLEGFPERYFKGKKAEFTQKIKIKSKENFKLKITYDFMACKTACFPPESREIELTIKGAESTEEPLQTDVATDTAVVSQDGGEWLTNLASTCEGFSYYNNFYPALIKPNSPIKKNENTYTLSFEIQMDSIFNLYDFENSGPYTSKFKLIDADSIELIGLPSYSLVSSNKVFTHSIGQPFVFTYSQDVKVNYSNKDTLMAVVDLYLQGCSSNFKTIAPVEIYFDLANPIYLDKEEETSSLWIIFLAAFASGFIALLTPCVFPMIPMTVTFFTKQSKTKSEGIRKALLYVIFIMVIYVLLGVLMSAIFGAGALNAMATNPWVNLSFAILFVIFAISFLGAFEIMLPTSWVNKADKQADKGGLIGIFFMAFTLALVSFSCTGPIVGTVLVQSAEGGEVIAPVIAMLGFSTALALPFGLFAAFPGWLNSLPQSGGWLNVVKVTLGLLEIAFALKFLLQADQGFETFIISREIFIAVWIAVFLVLGIYLLGFIQFPHDSKVEKVSVGRSLIGVMSLSFVFYLLPGMWGAPVNIISGLAPSKTYSESPYGVNMSAPEKADGLPESAEYHGHEIWVIKDYNEALEYAKKVKKPLLIDFTGIQCVNCRKMEDFVWAKEDIAPIMAEKFVIASLFVDDKAALPEEEWVTLADGTVIKEVGKKWFNFQTSKYAQGTQPLYVVVDHEEKNISGKASYDTHNDPNDFKKWLDNALVQFEKSMNPNVSEPEFTIIK